MIRLIEPLPPDERSIYIGFISLVIGIWVKSPSDEIKSTKLT